MMEIPEENKKRIFTAVFVFVIIVSVYFIVQIFSEMKKFGAIGDSTVPDTISFTGHGEVNAVPDIATLYFTISKVAKTVKEAQAGVADIEKKALELLTTKKVANKDVKTSNASFNPKYDVNYDMCPIGVTYNCGGKQVIVGYEATESITVKVRIIDDAGDIMQGLGTLGVSDLNGPNFAIDKEDALKAEARKLAIDDAKQKAETLATDLGVDLVKITSFSENGNFFPMANSASMMEKSSTDSLGAPAVLPKGENTITSDVTITYEIR